MELDCGGRRHRSLSDLTADSPYLRDFLQVKQDNKSANRTLGAILREKEPVKPILSNGKLHDIILDDSGSATSSGTNGVTVGSNRNTWRSFKDRLRLRHSDQNPESAHLVSSYNSTIGELISQPQLNPIPSNRAIVEESGERREAPARMSLLALLAKTDKQLGLSESASFIDEEAEAEDLSSKVEEYNNCCVCMIRRKGAAFIPCGHTFCRLCSRELWVQRGTCPICSKFILEILDIF